MYGLVSFGHCNIYESHYLCRKCPKPVTIQYSRAGQGRFGDGRGRRSLSIEGRSERESRKLSRGDREVGGTKKAPMGLSHWKGRGRVRGRGKDD